MYFKCFQVADQHPSFVVCSLKNKVPLVTRPEIVSLKAEQANVHVADMLPCCPFIQNIFLHL